MPATAKPPACRFRRARVADLHAILPLMIDFNRHEKIPWNARAGAPALRKLLASPRTGFVTLAFAGRVLVGYAIVTWGFDLEWNGPDSFLTELYIDGAARGRGVGAALLAHVERQARRRGGARAIHLMVRHDNRAARALYRQAGYIAPRRLLLTKPLPKK